MNIPYLCAWLGEGASRDALTTAAATVELQTECDELRKQARDEYPICVADEYPICS